MIDARILLENSHVIGTAAPIVLSKSPTWTHTFADSVYYSSFFLSLTDASFVSTQDKSRICPNCNFKTCDPASLTRHRIDRHKYEPAKRNLRETGESSKASTHHVPTIDSSSSQAGSHGGGSSSSLSIRCSWSHFQPLARHTPFPLKKVGLSSEQLPPHPRLIPSTQNHPCRLQSAYSNSPGPLLHESLPSLFLSSPPCSYSYTWDTSFLFDLNKLTADPVIQRFLSQFTFDHSADQP